jgi:hypothetical protein
LVDGTYVRTRSANGEVKLESVPAKAQKVFEGAWQKLGPKAISSRPTEQAHGIRFCSYEYAMIVEDRDPFIMM